MFTHVEAAGCTNACRHCGRGGGPPYGGFFSVAELRELVAEGWTLYPDYETSAHPEYPEILAPEICGEEIGEGRRVHPTNGFGIARADDPEALFGRLRELGFNMLSLTLHGLEDYHDWFVCRRGAYADIIRSTGLAQSNGFYVHWNIYPDNRNLESLPALLETCRDVGVGSGWPCLVCHEVSKRLHRYEKLRLSLRDVTERLAPGILGQAWPSIAGSVKAEPGELTEDYWLAVWRRSVDSEELRSEFTWIEPRLRITRQRRVFMHGPCAPVLLGGLAEGREALEERARRLPVPPAWEPPPPEAAVFEHSNLLHPFGYSIRLKAVSLKLYGAS